ncbi:MAG TPA: class I SAM-dependent methyltransferase [Streptosporangiaceae bacterium]|nr:class I SAM-dependent methyltransferase [Streptosporangiaceae bacterium]
MSVLAWDHNAYYHRLLLRHLPTPCGRVLDVGCGAGDLAAALARRADHVDALDRSPAMVELARRVVPSNVTCILADVLERPLPESSYDAIVSMSALHHMPLEEVLPRLARALRPGGVLATVALPRADPLREGVAELIAAIAHQLFGVAFVTLRAAGNEGWYAVPPSHAIMPVVLTPSLTTCEVRALARSLLPGSIVKRLVFWRYFLLWHKPALQPGSAQRRSST